MKGKKLIKVTAAFSQALAIALILFNSPPVYSYAKNNSTGPTLLCITPSPVVASREAYPGLSFSFSPVQVNFLPEDNWKLSTLLHTAELLTQSALKVPATIFNVYYRVPRIHAP